MNKLRAIFFLYTRKHFKQSKKKIKSYIKRFRKSEIDAKKKNSQSCLLTNL